MEQYGCRDYYIPHGRVVYCRFYSDGKHYCDYNCDRGYDRTVNFVYCAGYWRPQDACVRNGDPIQPLPTTTTTLAPIGNLTIRPGTTRAPDDDSLKGYYGDLPSINVSPAVYAGTIFGVLFLLFVAFAIIFIRLYKKKLPGDERTRSRSESNGNTTSTMAQTDTVPHVVFEPPAYDTIANVGDTPPAYDQLPVPPTPPYSAVDLQLSSEPRDENKMNDLPPSYAESIKHLANKKPQRNPQTANRRSDNVVSMDIVGESSTDIGDIVTDMQDVYGNEVNSENSGNSSSYRNDNDYLHDLRINTDNGRNSSNEHNHAHFCGNGNGTSPVIYYNGTTATESVTEQHETDNTYEHINSTDSVHYDNDDPGELTLYYV